MHPATWFFYGSVTFFLGLLSVASGGAVWLAKVLSLDRSDNAESLARFLVAVTLVVAATFVVGGVLAMRARDTRTSDEIG